MAYRNDRNPPRPPDRSRLPKKSGGAKMSDEAFERGAAQFRPDNSPRHPNFAGQRPRSGGSRFDQPRQGGQKYGARGQSGGWRGPDDRPRRDGGPRQTFHPSGPARPQDGRGGYAQWRRDDAPDQRHGGQRFEGQRRDGQRFDGQRRDDRSFDGQRRDGRQHNGDGRGAYQQRERQQREEIRTLPREGGWQKANNYPEGYSTIKMGDLMNKADIKPSAQTPFPPHRPAGAPTRPIRDMEQRRSPEPQRGYERGRQAGAAPEENDLPKENILAGRNPIREAMRAGRDLEKLMVAKGDLSGSAREIIAMAKERHIPVQEVDRAALDAVCSAHQGMVAYSSAYKYAQVEDILQRADDRGEEPFIVILDGVTDPHNLGAIIRTAECAGAHGVIVPERRAVGLTSAAVKASAGAVEHIHVARVTNLTKLIETLKKRGMWIAAGVTSGEHYGSADLSGPMALVIGGEGDGVSRLVLENCDKKISLPLLGKTQSLNASVAAGVLMYEVVRRRRA